MLRSKSNIKKLGLRPTQEGVKGMTKREFLTAVSNGEMTDELKEFAAAEIEKMNNSAAARAAKPSKAQLENAPLVDRIVNEILGTET